MSNQEKEEWARDSEREAMNIVFQIGDILEASVEKRQATNDKCINFVKKFLMNARSQALEQAIAEREKEYKEALDLLFEKHQIALREAREEVLREVEEKVIKMCRCDEIFTSRQLADPECQMHDFLDILSSLRDKK